MRTPNSRLARLSAGLLAFSLGLAVLPATAFAQQDDAKVQRYHFEDDDVVGELTKPDELRVTPVRHGVLGSLIEIRQDFVPELLQSVEAL